MYFIYHKNQELLCKWQKAGVLILSGDSIVWQRTCIHFLLISFLHLLEICVRDYWALIRKIVLCSKRSFFSLSFLWQTLPAQSYLTKPGRNRFFKSKCAREKKCWIPWTRFCIETQPCADAHGDENISGARVEGANGFSNYSNTMHSNGTALHRLQKVLD